MLLVACQTVEFCWSCWTALKRWQGMYLPRLEDHRNLGLRGGVGRGFKGGWLRVHTYV